MPTTPPSVAHDSTQWDEYCLNQYTQIEPVIVFLDKYKQMVPVLTPLCDGMAMSSPSM